MTREAVAEAIVKAVAESELIQSESTPQPMPHAAEPRADASHEVFALVLPEILGALTEPRTEKDLEEALGVVPAQAKAWLKRACDEGHVRKLGRPVRYVAAAKPPLLFESAEGNTRESQSHPRP